MLTQLLTMITTHKFPSLDHFNGPAGVVDEVGLGDLLLQRVLQLGVAGLLQCEVGEQVVDEGHEQRLVLVHQLGEVHVAEHAHHDRGLGVLGAGPFGRAEGSQHGQNVSQTKVVMHLK